MQRAVPGEARTCAGDNSCSGGGSLQKEEPERGHELHLELEPLCLRCPASDSGSLQCPTAWLKQLAAPR